MPLDESGSKESVGKNIRILKAEGKPHDQAVAIALDIQRRANKGKEKKASAEEAFQSIVKAYKDKLGVDLSYMNMEEDARAHNFDGSVSKTIDDNKVGGSHTKNNLIYLTDNPMEVMRQYGGISGSEDEFLRWLAGHELAHEVDATHLSDAARAEILAKAKAENFSTPYLESIPTTFAEQARLNANEEDKPYTETYLKSEAGKKDLQGEIDKELIAEYLAKLVTGHPGKKLITPLREKKAFAQEEYTDPVTNAATKQATTLPGDEDELIMELPSDKKAKTGPEAILQALRNIDLDEVERKAKDDIKSGKKTRRGKAVDLLNIVEGMRRNRITPDDLMLKTVPVIPAKYRPFSAMGGTLIPGDANVLYKDLMDMKAAHEEEREVFGDEYSGQSRLALYDAVRSVFGYGEPVKAKTRSKGVEGFLGKIVGSTSKFSYAQKKLFSKTVDNTGRSTIIVDPELSMDEIGIPKEIGFKMYAPWIQRRLKMNGMSDIDALKHVRDRTDVALRAMEEEGRERPVVWSRSPVWHAHGVMAAIPKFIDGKAISISPLTTTGAGADFDGDHQINRGFIMIDKEVLTKYDAKFSRYIEDISLLSPSSMVTFAAANNAELYMYKDTKISYIDSSMIPVEADFEDFPHGELTNVNKSNGYDIEFYAVPAGIKVPAYSEQENKLVLADVAYWSVHKGREVEIVNLRGGYQIYTDDDPRAVYGIPKDSMDLSCQRFTPTQALQHNVVVPVTPEVPVDAKLNTAYYSIADNKLTITPGKLHVPLDYDFGQFLGMMAGDGWVDYTIPSGTYHISDNEGYNGEWIASYIRKLFNHETVDVTLTRFDRSTPGRYGDTTRFSYHHKSRRLVVEMLHTLLGGEGDARTSGAANKHLPLWFSYAPIEFIKGLINGLVATDGSISVANAEGKNRPQLMIGFSSTSLRLCRELRRSVQQVGGKASITFSKVTDAGNDCWQVTISTPEAKLCNLFEHCAHIRKRETFLHTEVSCAPVNIRYDNLPYAACIAEYVSRWIICYDTSAKYKVKFNGAEAEWEARENEAAIASLLYDRKSEGCITRELAKRVVDIVESKELSNIKAIMAGNALMREIREKLSSVKSCEFTEKDRDILSAFIEAVLPKWYVNCELQETKTHAKRQVSAMARKKKATQGAVAILANLFATYRMTPDLPSESALWAKWKAMIANPTKWLLVTSVEKTGKVETGYDLTVPGYETFMSADGVILSNTINVHVPASSKAVKDAHEKMMPSTTPFSDREEGRIVPLPKQEQILGLYTANARPAKNVHKFATEAEALQAVKTGKIPLSDEIEIG